MDIILEPSEQALVNTAREFTTEMVVPNAADWEFERRVPLNTLQTAAKRGLMGLLVSGEYGGQGLSYTALARIMEEIAAGCLPFAFSLVVHNNLADNICRNGTPEQISRFVPGLVRGEQIGAFCLTEPGAGSDAAAIITQARSIGEDWILNGLKAWVTNGAVANLFSVYAQTDPALGWKGIVCILIEDKVPGLKRGEVYRMLGAQAMGTSELILEDCRIGTENLLIGPGDAFKAAMRGISLARATVGAMCCGMMRVSLECAVSHVSRRQAFGRRIADFQGIQWQLADVATTIEASRLLAYQATRSLDRGEDATVMAAHAKKYATSVALTNISTCMQTMGAEGLRSEHPLGRHLTSAKVAQYLDGTTEIQNVVISRALFKSGD